MTTRRKLLGAIGVVAFAIPYASHAQKGPAKVWRIGFWAFNPVALPLL